jgi:hypothetical protein
MSRGVTSTARLRELLADGNWHRLNELFGQVEREIPLHYAMRHVARRQPRVELDQVSPNDARWSLFEATIKRIGVERHLDDPREPGRIDYRVRLRDAVRDRRVGQRRDDRGGTRRMKVAYASPWIAVRQALDRIVDATGCDDVDAWRAFCDAAADGALQVRILGGVPGVTPSSVSDVPLVPVGYWLRAKLRGDQLMVMTDWSRMQVRQAGVEQLWPFAQSASAAPEPSTTSARKRGPKPALRTGVEEAMRKRDADELAGMKLIEMATVFKASAATCRRARKTVLSDFQETI